MKSTISMKKLTFHGSSKIGERGQVVIPKDARRDMQLKPGDEVLFIGGGKRLMMMKSSALDEWLEGFSETLKEIKRLSKK